MPAWALPVINFIGQRFVHIAVAIAIGLVIWGVYYKLFVKATTSTRIVYTQPVTQKHYLEGAHYAPFSCVRIVVPKGE